MTNTAVMHKKGLCIRFKITDFMQQQSKHIFVHLILKYRFLNDAKTDFEHLTFNYRFLNDAKTDF